jgi:ABC-type nickel/cobalt efflux system permease component RcnA
MHVLSGPDHLIAVAPFAMKRPWIGLRIGVHWGLGHACGVMFVGAIGVLLRSFINVELLSRFAEGIIGFVLIGVGVWAILQTRNILAHSHSHLPASNHEKHVTSKMTFKELFALHLTKRQFEKINHADHHSLLQTAPNREIHAHPHAYFRGDSTPFRSPKFRVVPGSFLVGILHGAAGTGHLLGVIPTLSLPPILGAFYLCSFGIAAVVAMGVFGLMMGILGNRLAPAILRRFMFGSGTMAIVLGLIWLRDGWRDARNWDTLTYRTPPVTMMANSDVHLGS